MKISGHKTRSILQRYNITKEENLKQAAQRLDTRLKEFVTIKWNEEEKHFFTRLK
ncbi:MAG: hypothetical protein JXL20_06915 [Deltaproteobacteria bacterium]|nr:hypothetical protein [Deltaproteobacteria bacterium]